MHDPILIGRVVLGILQGLIRVSWGFSLRPVVESSYLLISIDALIDLLHSELIPFMHILDLPLLDIIKRAMVFPLPLLHHRIRTP